MIKLHIGSKKLILTTSNQSRHAHCQILNTDSSACSLQWGQIPSPSLMFEEQLLHKKKPHG
ncbi:hypothetical protein OUZ56_011452 [Daphnia magna]|uniref:Uncharacterized protein n=1 Tax=Daphnia magna TaxID=35525 RepID=A0ABQ9Z075_9CRUS|nr:hypothetical protein OUZ56_011452 [Daphnia magna]